MATEVKHGPNPTFNAEIRGEFSLTLVGHQTTTPDLAAGGVTAVKYDSDQDGKRRAQLLAMRTIFLEWWVATRASAGLRGRGMHPSRPGDGAEPRVHA
jgi:hypothetical protein